MARDVLQWCARDLDRHPDLRHYIQDTSPVMRSNLDQLVRHGDSGGAGAGALVILLRFRTVAKVDNDRICSSQMDPVLGRKVVERQQLLDVVGDLGDRLRKLHTIGRLELLDRVAGVGLVLGVPDLCERLLRPRVRRLRQRGKNIRYLCPTNPT
jgi:hypothetical protein